MSARGLRSVLRPALLAALATLSSCAFANRDNRPVWNAFESTMVPDGGAAFWSTLPLTVPVGLGAILVDTFVAHPLQVVDDAWDDTVDVWRGLEFEEHYYTESASLPFRAVWSPVVFAGSFLGRSAFDWPSEEDREARREQRAAKRRAATLTWLGRIAAGDDVRAVRRLPEPVDSEIATAVAAALAGGTAHGRMLVYDAVSKGEDSTIVDWLAALADPSAVVRYHVLADMPKSLEVPQDAIARLLSDPDEAVRERARRRWQ